MKEVRLDDKIVRTPWLRPGEAAAYCGLSISTFQERARGLTRGGMPRAVLFHVEVLDGWLAAVCPDGSCPPSRPGVHKGKSGAAGGLINPANGKVFRYGEGAL